jgi:acetyl-CoA C-acetyltransferase
VIIEAKKGSTKISKDEEC